MSVPWDPLDDQELLVAPASPRDCPVRLRSLNFSSYAPPLLERANIRAGARPQQQAASRERPNLEQGSHERITIRSVVEQQQASLGPQQRALQQRLAERLAQDTSHQIGACPVQNQQAARPHSHAQAAASNAGILLIAEPITRLLGSCKVCKVSMHKCRRDLENPNQCVGSSPTPALHPGDCSVPVEVDADADVEGDRQVEANGAEEWEDSSGEEDAAERHMREAVQYSDQGGASPSTRIAEEMGLQLPQERQRQVIC